MAAAKQHKPTSLLRATGTAVLAKAVAATGRPEPMLPLVGPPGSRALLSLDGYEEAYTSVAGPTWRNEVGASIGGAGLVPPAPHAASSSSPCSPIADQDRSAPRTPPRRPRRPRRVRHCRATTSPVRGRPCHDRAVRHALRFLRRHVPLPTVAPAG